MQYANKQTPATVEVLLDYNNGNGVFYVVHAEMLEAVPVEFHSSQSCQQFSLVK
jgi:hypothetical protein